MEIYGNHSDHTPLTTTALFLSPSGRQCITSCGLMNNEQYDHAFQDLITRMQLIRERESPHVDVTVLNGPDHTANALDDPIVIPLNSEQSKAIDEFREYCNLVKRQRFLPKSYIGETLKLGSIEMGKVGEQGDDIKGTHPFVQCNLATFIGDDGRFDLVSFLQLQQGLFPTLYKLAVCLSSIRTNEVGCERFFSTAGYVSCPRRTSLKVRNYECLATLKANIRNVFIDERWVVDKYLAMEAAKSWDDFETENDMTVLNLEREVMAEHLGVSTEDLPPIADDKEPINEPETVEVESDSSEDA